MKTCRWCGQPAHEGSCDEAQFSGPEPLSLEQINADERGLEKKRKKAEGRGKFPEPDIFEIGDTNE